MVNVSDRILRIFRLRRAEPRAAPQSCDYFSFNSKWDMEIIPISHFIFLYHICAADASIFFMRSHPEKDVFPPYSMFQTAAVSSAVAELT